MAPGSTTGRLVNQTKRRYQAPIVPMISWNTDEVVKRLSDTIKPALPCRATSSLGIEQSVQVNDEITHVRVVDGLLRFLLPCDGVTRILRVDADDINLVEILELCASELGELATEDEMQQLRFRCGQICRHGSIYGSISGKVRSTLCEFRFSVAHQSDQGVMAGLTGCDERAVHGLRTVVFQRPSREIGQRTAGFVHQKVGCCKSQSWLPREAKAASRAPCATRASRRASEWTFGWASVPSARFENRS